MMEPVAWAWRNNSDDQFVVTLDEPEICWEKQPLVRLSDAEARIATLEAELDEALKGNVVPSSVWMEQLEKTRAAEALLKEADTLAKIAIGAEKMMNGAAIYFAADGERDDAKKLTKVATIMGEHARALKSKIGVKDE